MFQRCSRIFLPWLEYLARLWLINQSMSINTQKVDFEWAFRATSLLWSPELSAFKYNFYGESLALASSSIESSIARMLNSQWAEIIEKILESRNQLFAHFLLCTPTTFFNKLLITKETKSLKLIHARTYVGNHWKVPSWGHKCFMQTALVRSYKRYNTIFDHEIRHVSDWSSPMEKRNFQTKDEFSITLRLSHSLNIGNLKFNESQEFTWLWLMKWFRRLCLK